MTRIAPAERDAIVAALLEQPPVAYAKIAARFNRHPLTVAGIARAWGVRRKGR